MAAVGRQVMISFVDVGGFNLRLSVTGTGPPLMFLFGSGAAGTIENAQQFIDKFSQRFTVACIDQRGLGQSDIPDGPWTMSDYSADAYMIADHLGWDNFSVIGLSFGGMVSLEMAASIPDRIDRMVLWGVSPGGAAHSYPLHTLDTLPTGERMRLFAQLMDTRLATPMADPQSPEAQLVTAVLERGGSPWSVTPGDDPARTRGLALQLEARRGHDVTSRMKDILCETFIGAGVYDGLAPAANAKAMHAGIRNSYLRIYQAGHFFYLERKAFSDGFGFLAGAVPAPSLLGVN